LKSFSRFLFACAAAGVIAGVAAQVLAAEPVVRVKAKLTAFDGQVMSLQALSSPSGVVKEGEPFTVSVLPQTRYVGSDKSSLEAIKVGDYAGAAVTEAKDGGLRAREVYLYAPQLRGTGEGRFSEGDRLIVNGTVSAIQPPANGQKNAKANGSLTLHYSGAALSGLGRGRTVCEGRALPPAYASALACQGDAQLDVPPGTEVSSLTVGDKSLLVVGRTVTVAMTKDAGNKNVAPGVVVEKTMAAGQPATVEKPQSTP
jgi:hypothetical protein